MDTHDHAGQGKIQTCPMAIRAELNRRLLDGQTGAEVLPWLNGLREVNDICCKRFGGVPVSDKNLSDYRTNAYQKWLKQRATMERQKELNAYALDLVRSSGTNLSSAAAAMAAGKLLAAVEALGDEETAPEDMVSAINDLRKGDHKEQEIRLKRKALEHDERALRQKEESLVWNIAKKIAAALENRELLAVHESKASDEAKMRDYIRIVAGDDLLARMFPADKT